jgi:hypothetical protein
VALGFGVGFWRAVFGRLKPGFLVLEELRETETGFIEGPGNSVRWSPGLLEDMMGLTPVYCVFAVVKSVFSALAGTRDMSRIVLSCRVVQKLLMSKRIVVNVLRQIAGGESF